MLAKLLHIVSSGVSSTSRLVNHHAFCAWAINYTDHETCTIRSSHMRERGSRYHDTIPPCRDNEARGELPRHQGSGQRHRGRGGGRGRQEERRKPGTRTTWKIPGRLGFLMPGNGRGGWRGRPERPHVPGAAANPRPRGRGRSSPHQGPAPVSPRALPDLTSPRPGPTCLRYSPAPALGAALSPPSLPFPCRRGRPSPRCPPWARSPRSARRFLPRAPPAFTSFPQPAPRRRRAPWETPAPPQPRSRAPPPARTQHRPPRPRHTDPPTPPACGPPEPAPVPALSPSPGTERRLAPSRPPRRVFVVPFPRRFSHRPPRHGGDRAHPGPRWRPREGKGDVRAAGFDVLKGRLCSRARGAAALRGSAL